MAKQKVEVQKGPIVADQVTMKTMKRIPMNQEDHTNDKMRRDGQTLKYHQPKV